MSELTLEQELSLRMFAVQVQKMSAEQAQEFLVKLYEQMLIREVMYQHLLKSHWGLGESFVPP